MAEAQKAERRSQLVQQLLSERRHRLEEKLAEQTPRRNLEASWADWSPSGTPRRTWSPRLFDTPPGSVLPSSPSERAGRSKLLLPDSIGKAAASAPADDVHPCYSCRADVLPDSAFCGQCGRRNADATGMGSDASGLTAARGTASLASQSPRTRHSFREKLREWSDLHQAQMRKKEDAKVDQEMRLKEQCTFRPAINQKSDAFAKRTRGCFAESLDERLYNDARRRSALRAKAKEVLEADDLYECTFTPRINAQRNGNEARIPLHLRSEAIQQTKQERTKAMQEALGRQLNLPFQPKLSARSQQLAQRRRQGAGRSASQEGRMRTEVLDAGASSTLDAPAPRRAASLDGPRRAPSAPQAFLQRQHSYEEARRYRNRLRAEHAEADFTFRPAISESSEHLRTRNPEMLGESLEERIERLAVRDVARRRLVRNEMQKSMFRDCTFTPKVSPQSALINSERACRSPAEGGVYDRLYQDALAKEKIRGASADFETGVRPQLDRRASKLYAHVRPHYGKPADIMASVQQQQDRRAEQLLRRHAEREHAEFADCTFRPELREPLTEHQPVVVSGLSRYFELRSLAQRQQEAQREREAKVFRAAGGPSNGITIPEPFALSSGNGFRSSQGSVRSDSTRAR